jgi:arginase family enzyme
MQNDDGYTERAAKAVVTALLDAGRLPGSAEVNLDLDAAMDALCRAVFMIAATGTQFDQDREQAARLIEAFEQHISVELMALADKVREGTVPPRARPTLRIVP